MSDNTMCYKHLVNFNKINKKFDKIDNKKDKIVKQTISLRSYDLIINFFNNQASERYLEVKNEIKHIVRENFISNNNTFFESKIIKSYAFDDNFSCTQLTVYCKNKNLLHIENINFSSINKFICNTVKTFYYKEYLIKNQYYLVNSIKYLKYSSNLPNFKENKLILPNKIIYLDCTIYNSFRLPTNCKYCQLNLYPINLIYKKKFKISKSKSLEILQINKVINTNTNTNTNIKYKRNCLKTNVLLLKFHEFQTIQNYIKYKKIILDITNYKDNSKHIVRINKQELCYIDITNKFIANKYYLFYNKHKSFEIFDINYIYKLLIKKGQCITKHVYFNYIDYFTNFIKHKFNKIIYQHKNEIFIIFNKHQYNLSLFSYYLLHFLFHKTLIKL